MDKLWLWLSWRLPRRLVYWCSVRVTVEAAALHPDWEIPTMTAIDAANAFDGSHCILRRIETP